jgi:hypothetical protein
MTMLTTLDQVAAHLAVPAATTLVLTRTRPVIPTSRGTPRTSQLVVGGGSNEFAIEVELTSGALGEIRALPPEQAYAIARESDATRTPPIEEGPVDPMMPPNERG